jgi:hypothetical protein
MELGFSDLDHVRGDPDLATFRELPEFQELLADPPTMNEPAGDDGEVQAPVAPQVQFRVRPDF